MFQFRDEINSYPQPEQNEIYFECELFFQSTFGKLKMNQANLKQYQFIYFN